MLDWQLEITGRNLLHPSRLVQTENDKWNRIEQAAVHAKKAAKMCW